MGAEVAELIKKHLSDWRTGWSMGSFGAIGEFHWDDGEADLVEEKPLSRATERGAIRFNASTVGELQPVAYETPSPKPRRWSQGVVMCLPADKVSAARRTNLTFLGPDDDAIRDDDREAMLFDMGLSLPNCDFCIRTSDPELINILQEHKGQSLFGTGHSAMGEILKRHPHRVAVTSAGRVEVYQKIGGPDTGGVSPPGPHTHVLPKPLKTGRTHSANTPVPEGLVPVASMHPGNPVIDEMGRDRAFDAGLDLTFRDLMQRFGSADCLKVKEALEMALSQGDDPESFDALSGRFQRAALKVGLRQHERLAEYTGDEKRSSTVAQWLQRFGNVRDDRDTDDDAPGH